MSAPGQSRKRPAPGTSPLPLVPPPPSSTYQYPELSENADFNFDFSQHFGNDQLFPDTSAVDIGNLAVPPTIQSNSNLSDQLSGNAQSTDLVRRARNQHLAPAIASQDTWTGHGTTNTLSGDEDEQELDMKVQMAKRDAQGKRKQIPPFVQKLSSFLDSNNTDLIRWSDDGRSFIVLDEDEFARTLIPELFKHNNYASFVRQLNMYGFHKTVNITDGSLRQSEKARKGVKPPSMYSHPYFRKNRPDLLWLIQKPNSKSTAKRKRDGTTKDESDDERQYSPAPEGKPHDMAAHHSTSDLATLPRNELATVRNELQKLQAQQRFISKMIAQLKEQNEQFYRQASAFQALHDRHENSINAILTFLATFYNRSLDGSGAQNLVNMFNNHAQNNQQHGSVVEEYNDPQPDQGEEVRPFARRPRLLLEGPSVAETESPSPRDPTRNVSVSARASASPASEHKRHESAASGVFPERPTAASPVVKTDAPTPDIVGAIPENEEMMNIINSVNANNASTPNDTPPSVEFNSALNNYQYAGGKAPLTKQQRDQMLALMANQQGDTSRNNALLAPQAPAMPDLNQLKQTQQQLEMLTNMQRQQDERVQELNRRLQPLSPTGSIPGLAETEENPFDITGAPGDFDPNAFVNFDDWNGGNSDFNFDFGTTGANADVDWDFGNSGADGGADMFQTAGAPASHDYGIASQATGEHAKGRVSSISSSEGLDDGAPGNGETPNKRVRMSKS